MLGPVFERGLAISARKGRSYALRSAYGLALLAVLVAGYRNALGTDLVSRPLSDTHVTKFARELFWHLVLMQGVAVVVLTPASVAGAIADEVQRKTLGDLLTSDLSAAEIVLVKLAVRLLHVGLLVIAGLPILLLTGLLSRLAPRLVLASVAATLSTAFFLGGLSILGSTQTRSVRGAINFFFTLTPTWLVLPGAIDVLLPRKGAFGLRLYAWFGPINTWIAPTSPFALLVEALRGSIRGPGVLTGRILGMVGLEVLYGSVLTALAVVRLRPSFRVREGPRERRRSGAPSGPFRLRRSLWRVPCGLDPMSWEERFIPRISVFYRPLGLSIAPELGGLLVRGTTDFALSAFRALASDAPGIGRACGSPGGRSNDRNANRSANSSRSSNDSIPSGIIDSLLTREYFTLLRAMTSFPPPGSARTILRSLSSVTSPVRFRPSSVTTVVV
jgi:hypothetical protein